LRNGPESKIQLLFVFKESQAQGSKSDAELQPLPNGFELTGLNPEFLRDPHPMLDRLRQDAPHHIHAHAHFLEAPAGPYLTQIAVASYQRDPRATPPGSLARAFAPAGAITSRSAGACMPASARRSPVSRSTTRFAPCRRATRGPGSPHRQYAASQPSALRVSASCAFG
jgi:hypothetical protein